MIIIRSFHLFVCITNTLVCYNTVLLYSVFSSLTGYKLTCYLYLTNCINFAHFPSYLFIYYLYLKYPMSFASILKATRLLSMNFIYLVILLVFTEELNYFQNTCNKKHILQMVHANEKHIEVSGLWGLPWWSSG